MASRVLELRFTIISMTQAIASTLLIVASLVASSPVLAQSLLEKGQTVAVSQGESDLIVSDNPVETETRFNEEGDVVVSSIPFPTEYIDDPEAEYGTEVIQQEGVEGILTETYKITLWDDEEIDRVLIDSETVEPVTEIVTRGTKIIWKELPTFDQGTLEYWAKLNVWATSYDGNCLGCRGLTYSGTPVKVGTCATDPSVIPLGTNFYVPGYGICRAEDIGGAIKGNSVDLGFEDVRNGWWSARFVDVYLLSNAPY